MREEFNKSYKEIHPDDKSTEMPNGNYSGWIKQAHWWAWQSRQIEVDDLNNHHLNYVNGVLEAEAKYLDEIDSLKVQLSLQRDRNKALETELTNSRNHGDSLHSQLNNMEQCYIQKKKEVEDLEQVLKHLSEMNNKSISYEHDLFDKGWNQCAKQTVENIFRVTGIREGKTLRGDDDQHFLG